MKRRLIIAAATTVSIAACAPFHRGGVVRFHGEATDPIGDTAGIADARVARPADLTYAGARVTDDVIRFKVRFAPGSLDRATTGVMFVLDTDRDSTTGQRSPGLGEDYIVTLNAGPAPEATIARAMIDADCPGHTACRFEPFQRVEAIVSTDEMDVVVPRSAVAPFDGRFNFRVIAYARLGSRGTGTSDHLPNLPTLFVVVR